MATYSTNLGLTLLTTGEGAGTWGNTTNTNLGTLLEQAISGYVTESLTAGTTLTLTIPNGATGVARNMYLEFTGNGSTVIVPSNKKLYFVYNNCASGTISFKVSGQAGVSIPKGSKQILVSNGTDVIEAIPPGLDGTTVVANTTLGVDAGAALTTGTENVFVGYNAGELATSAAANTSVGSGANDSLTTGSYNVAVGYLAGAGVTSGLGNAFVGYRAGLNVTTSNTNAALGDSAYLTGNYAASTCIGYDSAVDGNNQIQLGRSVTTTYAYGAVQDRSDARDKADITDTNLGLNFIMQLQPRMFRWDMREDYRPPKPANNASKEEWAAYSEACKLDNLTHDGTHKRTRFHQGLIAQEVKAVMDSMGVDFGGYQDHKINGGQDVLTIGYEELIAPLIKAVQELKAEFDEYKRTHP